MGQVTIYLDNETEKELREAVKQEKTSLSKWISRLIHEKVSTTWPAEVAEMAGTWPEALTREQLREEEGHDAPREPL